MEHLWKIVVEIAVLWFFIYMALFFIKGTRTEQLLKGVLIIVVIYILSQQLGLDAIRWVLTRLFPISVIALLIIFQPELRRGLARLGQFGVYREDIEAIEEIAKSVTSLSSKKIGALIAIEREVGLRSYIESGVPIDSRVSSQLIITIFTPLTPLHDGAVIVQRDRVVAAGCLLPLQAEAKLPLKRHGTRHRAALGLSEETDAVCIVVSEETGSVSIAIEGKLENLDLVTMTETLKNIFYRNVKHGKLHTNLLSAKGGA